MQKIWPCLWFANNATDAANYYAKTFKNVKVGGQTFYSEEFGNPGGQKPGTVMTQDFEIEGLKILGLNGGDYFKLNPSISFFVNCREESDVQDLWRRLSDSGVVRMGLDRYPWAELYGWTEDRFGVNWQIGLNPDQNENVALTPAFLFTQKNFGKAEEAIEFYMKHFKESEIQLKAKNESGKHLDFCAFKLAGQDFIAMDGAGEHDFTFNEAFSLMVLCDSQKEIDYYWDELVALGGQHSHCGWLKDRYGVAWQIIPDKLSDWQLESRDRCNRMMKEVLKMKKLDYSTLKNA